MTVIDQTPRGLLVPGWRVGAKRKFYAVAVVMDCPRAGDYVGLTVLEAARKAGVSGQTAQTHLEAGYLPGRKPKTGNIGPHTEQSAAWRQKHLPRSLWAVSLTQLAAALGVSVNTVTRLAKEDRSPATLRRRKNSPQRELVRQIHARSQNTLATIMGVR